MLGFLKKTFGAAPEPVDARALALGDPNAAAYTSIQSDLDRLGKIAFRHETSFKDPEAVLSFVADHGIEFVIMPNPYGNPTRLAIYRLCRKRDVPVVVFDRGGLPDSWFFDVGFNHDSPSYSPLLWDHPLEPDAGRAAKAYVEALTRSDNALEDQGGRIGGAQLRASLGLTGKKILFVPLQRPLDTTIKYFSGNVADVPDFCNEIHATAQALAADREDWVVLCKKHPLETERPDDRLTYLDDDVHIHDILEACDAVALVNSGVGLLAACFQKPVFHFGKIYYRHPGLNRPVEDAADLVTCLRHGPFAVDPETCLRLIWHLTSKIYSFGTFHTERVLQEDGSYRNITRKIEFSELRFPEFAEV